MKTLSTTNNSTNKVISVAQELSWQEELASLITCAEELLAKLSLPKQYLPDALKASELFPLRVTASFIRLIEPKNIDDPLLRQILPLKAEFCSANIQNKPNDFSFDPLGEKTANIMPGLVHKYHGRVLLIAATQCAINCRYCFRRSFDYAHNAPSRDEWLDALAYIAKDSSIEEVILSGGDPLALSDKQLKWLIDQIEKIPHVNTLRIHSRLPIVLPSRMTKNLLSTISQHSMQTVFVVHSNHANEISPITHTVFTRMRQHGITLLNQSVLLKGVNDSQDALINLSKTLFNSGVLPYYLHVLDKVIGSAHFDVNTKEAIALVHGIRQQLPGYLVPTLVKEIAGRTSKTPML